MGFQLLIPLNNWKIAHQKATGVVLIQWTQEPLKLSKHGNKLVLVGTLAFAIFVHGGWKKQWKKKKNTADNCKSALKVVSPVVQGYLSLTENFAKDDIIIDAYNTGMVRHTWYNSILRPLPQNLVQKVEVLKHEFFKEFEIPWRFNQQQGWFEIVSYRHLSCGMLPTNSCHCLFKWKVLSSHTNWTSTDGSSIHITTPQTAVYLWKEYQSTN